MKLTSTFIKHITNILVPILANLFNITFDQADHSILLAKLAKLSMPYQLIRVIANQSNKLAEHIQSKFKIQYQKKHLRLSHQYRRDLTPVSCCTL